jgi:hypothetical protein
MSLHTDRSDESAIPVSTENLGRLTTWLAASGDFKEEVRRLEIWGEFFSEGTSDAKLLEKIIDFAKWFEKSSLEALGRYTLNVEKFLDESHASYRWREDYVFTGRRQVEYHLNVVGMEIMNRAFREQFLKAEHKIVFVPPCMANPQDGTCQAVDTPYGAHCAHCTPSCQVNQVTKYGEKHGIQVFMIPDSFSPLNDVGSEGMKDRSLGVVGVSCPLTIVSGGFEMKRLNIPAQGVLLDHCGCPWHWALDKAIITEINFKQLTRTLATDE